MKIGGEQLETSAEQEAYLRIKKALIMKKLNPGQQLTEEWIGKNLNMSRTPIRSALKSLEKEGLINIFPHRGAFVANPSRKEIIDVFHVRILLESHAIEQAIPFINDEHINTLAALLKDEKEAYETRNFEDFIEINNKIHQLPAEVFGNQCLLDQITSLITFTNCFLILKDTFYIQPIEKVKSIPEHELIVEALKNREKSKAKKALINHLETSVETYVSTKNTSIF